MSAISTKRKFEGSEFSAQKRACIRKKYHGPINFESLIRYFFGQEPHIGASILKNFSYRELLTLEAVSPTYFAYTQKRWKELRVAEFADLDWPHTSTEKGQYIQSKILFAYVTREKPLFLTKEKPNLQKLYSRLEGVMLAHKCTLGAYLWHDLSLQTIIDFKYAGSFKFVMTPEASQKNVTFLCRGLLSRNSNQMSFMSTCFEQAIYRGATCASFLAAHYSFDTTCLRVWSLMSASKNDFRGLEYFLNKNPTFYDQYYKEYKKNSILISYAKYLLEQKQFSKAAEILHDGIRLYPNQIPLKLLWKTAEGCYCASEYKSAATMFDDYIKIATENRVAPLKAEHWHTIAKNQFALKEYHKASKFFEKAIASYGIEHMAPPAMCLLRFAGAYFYLKNYPEAKKFFDQAIKAFGQEKAEIPSKLWVELFETEFHLNNYQQCVILYATIENICIDKRAPIPNLIERHMQVVNSMLNKEK